MYNEDNTLQMIFQLKLKLRYCETMCTRKCRYNIQI